MKTKKCVIALKAFARNPARLRTTCTVCRVRSIFRINYKVNVSHISFAFRKFVSGTRAVNVQTASPIPTFPTKGRESLAEPVRPNVPRLTDHFQAQQRL